MPKAYKREFNIYQIANDVNDKVYVGSTTTELWHRMSQHKADAKKGCKAPVYDLMREIGIEHFKISLIKKSDAEHLRVDEEKAIADVSPERRLNFKQTTRNDTSLHYDYDEIVGTYLRVGSQNMTANIIGCSTMTVKKALRRHNVEITYPPHTAHKLITP